MKVKKYRLGSQIKYTPWTFEQLGYAPSLMRQRHDQAVEDMINLENQLNFEYLNQDDPFVAPIIDKYKKGLDTLQSNILKRGYNPSLVNDLVKYRRDYQNEVGPRGTLGRAMKAYSDAQEGWKSIEASYRKDNMPEAYINKAKSNYFGAYKGMMTPDGIYQGFTPGAVTGYRDIAKDFVTYAKEAGMSTEAMNQLQKEGVSIKQVDGPYGTKFLAIHNYSPGTPGYDNAKQLEALYNEFYSQYTDPSSDRGLYAQIDQKSPQEIARTLSNMQTMMYQSRGGTPPKETISGLRQVDLPSGGSGLNLNGTPNFWRYDNVKTGEVSEISKDMEMIKSSLKDGKIDPESLRHEQGYWARSIQPYSNIMGGITDYMQYGGEAMINAYRLGQISKGRYAGNLVTHNNIAEDVFTGIGTGKQKVKRTNTALDLVNTKYGELKNLIDASKDTGIDYQGKKYVGDKGYLDLVEVLEAKSQLEVGKSLGLSNYITNTDWYKAIKETGEGKKVETLVNTTTGDFVSVNSVKDLLKTTPTSVTIDGNGNISMQLPTGKTGTMENYIINPKALPEQVSEDVNAMSEMIQKLYNFNMSAEDIKKEDKKTYILNDNYYKVVINPNNHLDKVLVRWVQDPDESMKTGKNMGDWYPVEPADLQNNLATKVVKTLNQGSSK